MNQKNIFILSFFLILILIFLELVGVFRLFLIPILWATIASLVLSTLYARFFRWFRGRRNLAAAVVVLIFIILTVGPMVLFSGRLVQEVLDFYATVGDWVAAKKYQELWNRILDSPIRMVWDKVVEKTASLNIEIAPVLGKAAQEVSQTIVGQIREGAKNFVFFVLNYIVTVFILFFFLRDGKGMFKAFKDLFPMKAEDKEALFSKLATTVTAVVRGLVITGGVQAVLAGLAFWVLGVPFPLFLALLVAFLALVPLGGAIVVWLPASVYLFLQGHWGKALALFLWGALVISMVDNFLKPILIGEKTKLPTLFLFLAIMGGLVHYGFIGIFLGPVVLTFFMTMIQIYRKDFMVPNT